MSSDIKKWVQQCERCQVAKDTGQVPQSYMGHLLASRPNKILALLEHFTLLEPSWNRFENVLALTDVFSKFIVAVPIRDQRASTVVQVLVCPALPPTIRLVMLNPRGSIERFTAFCVHCHPLRSGTGLLVCHKCSFATKPRHIRALVSHRFI